MHRCSQYEANCVLVSFVIKSSLNTALKCSILRSNNKKKSGESSMLLPRWGRDTPPHSPPISSPWAPRLDLSTLPSLKLKSGYTLGDVLQIHQLLDDNDDVFAILVLSNDYTCCSPSLLPVGSQQ